MKATEKIAAFSNVKFTQVKFVAYEPTEKVIRIEGFPVERIVYQMDDCGCREMIMETRELICYFTCTKFFELLSGIDKKGDSIDLTSEPERALSAIVKLIYAEEKEEN